MADEQTFNIPLRKEFQKVPSWNKAKKAVKATRAFLIRQLKVENVLLGKHLHEELMKHGRQNPPHHVKVRVWKDGEKYKADLIDAPREEKKVEVVKGKKPAEKITEVSKPKTEDHEKAEEKKEVLEHEKVKHKEHHPREEGKLEDKKVMESERHTNMHSHGQKPTHEKSHEKTK